MAIRNVVTKENEQLRKKSREIVGFDEKLHTLLDDMYDTMMNLDGVGIAAPQVGILRKVAIVQIDDENKYELVNPYITRKEGESQGLEGCLSCPNQWGLVTRPETIDVTYWDRNGKEINMTASGFLSRAIQHEMDHLNGVLFIDIVDKFLDENELEEYMNSRK